METQIRRTATLIGCGALGLWIAEALVVSELTRVPLFQMLSMVFTTSFLVTALRVTRSKKWHLMRQHWSVWILGICGICGSDVAYIYAARVSPIAHIELIDYSWPCLIVFFSGLVLKDKITPNHYLGALLGLFSSYVLVSKDFNFMGVHPEFLSGYLIAIAGAAMWAGYSILSRHQKSIPTEMVGLYSGVGAIIVITLHFITGEVFVMPSLPDCLLASILGLTGAGCAYQLWDYGVKYGNLGLLSALTYFARLLSMAVLVAFDKEPFSIPLVVACMIATFGVYLSSIEWYAMKTWFKNGFVLSKDEKLVNELSEE